MIRVPLANSTETALVDDEDADLVADYTWRSIKPLNVTYAYTKAADGGMLYMHRLIMDASPLRQVDHRNRDGLDNRRMNLRVGSRSENAANTGKRQLDHVPTSQYKGVHLDSWTGRWKAAIRIDGKNRTLGRYISEEEAARVYDRAALRAWGEFAFLNFPADCLAGVGTVHGVAVAA